MKILHFLPTLRVGGAERALTNLAIDRANPDIQHVVVPFLAGGYFERELAESGVVVRPLAMTKIGLIFAFFRLYRIVRAFDPDIIQGWMYYGNLVASLARFCAGSKKQVKLIWGIRCSYMDFSRYGPHLRLAVWLSAKLSRQPDLIIANSYVGLDEHQKLGFCTERFGVIDNGFDTDRFKPMPMELKVVREELGLSPDQLVCIIVARVDAMKDYPLAIKIAQSLPGILFLAVGSDTETLAGPPNFRGLGARSDIPKLLAASNMLLSTSRGEGMSNVIGEAMASGNPIVATDCGDVRRLVVGEVNDDHAAGFLCPVGDGPGLADAIRVLAGDPIKRAEMSKNARERVLKEFSIKRMQDKWKSAYRAVLENELP